jgi:molecular chaperone DnaK (HSP70)
MEGDGSKPLDHPDNVMIWNGEVQIPEPRPMAEITLEFTYEYDENGILYVTLKDLERDSFIPPFDRMPITFGVTKDRKALVQLAGRVNETIETQSLAVGSIDETSNVKDERARELVSQARTKVIPFLDDEQAKALLERVEAVESAVNDDLEVARGALETELRRYSYLL